MSEIIIGLAIETGVPPSRIRREWTMNDIAEYHLVKMRQHKRAESAAGGRQKHSIPVHDSGAAKQALRKIFGN